MMEDDDEGDEEPCVRACCVRARGGYMYEIRRIRCYSVVVRILSNIKQRGKYDTMRPDGRRRRRERTAEMEGGREGERGRRRREGE